MTDLTLLKKFVPKRTYCPTLETALFRTDGSITVTDLDTWATVYTGVPFGRECLVEVKQTLLTPKSTLTSNLAIDGYPVPLSPIGPSDYPPLPVFEPEITFSVPLNVLATALKQTLPAVAGIDDLPHVLQCVCFDFVDESLVLAATDTHRLSIAALPVTSVVHNQYVVYAEMLKKLLPYLKGDAVKVELSSRYARFTWGDYAVTTSLLDAQYPDYRKVMPTNISGSFLFKVDEIKPTLERFTKLVKLSKTTSNRVHFYRNAECDWFMRCESSVPEVKISPLNGEPFALNGHYLLDILNAYQTASKGANVLHVEYARLFLFHLTETDSIILAPMEVPC